VLGAKQKFQKWNKINDPNRFSFDQLMRIEATPCFTGVVFNPLFKKAGAAQHPDPTIRTDLVHDLYARW
jgi:hypothetical protein